MARRVKGGRCRFARASPSGRQNTPFGGEYLEILPDCKIIHNTAFETPGANILHSHNVVRRSAAEIARRRLTAAKMAAKP
jgi:hypothetical protein